MSYRQKPNACSGCSIYDHGLDFSQVEGTGSNGCLLVGEASGEMEARDQLPFRPYAPAGAVLERCLRRMGLDRKQFAVSNCVRCRPRRNFLENSPWEYAALRQCRPNLDSAIAQYRPKCIVALGGVALRELTGEAGESRGITHLAGYVMPLAGEVRDGDKYVLRPQSIPVIADFHPSYLRRGKASYQGVFSRIIQRALAIAAGRDRNYAWGIDPDDSATWNTPAGKLNYWTHPTTDQARSVLAYLRDNPNIPFAADLETSESSSLDEDAREGFNDTEIRLVQFSYQPGTGIAMPWTDGFKQIAQDIFHLPNKMYGHNFANFDRKVLRAASLREGWTYSPKTWVFDTMDMFHHWQPDLPANLQFACSFIPAFFPWKHLASSNIEFYGVCDADNTLKLGLYAERMLKKDGLWNDDNYFEVSLESQNVR